MESRKVQRAGYSSLSVSLPINWVKEVGLKTGDMIFFAREKDNSLKLMLSDQLMSKVETKEFVVNSDLCDEPRLLERIIVGSYIIGHDALRIVSSERIRSEQIEEVRGIVRKLTGMSIIEATPSHIVILCSIDPEKFKLDMLLRRLSTITLTMLNEAIQAVVDLNPQLAKDVIRWEEEANAMYWLIVRLLSSAQSDRTVAEKIRLEDPLQITGDRLIAKSIEKIADWAERIAKSAITLAERSKKGITVFDEEAVTQLSNLETSIYGVFRKSMECVFSGDMRTANTALELRESIEREVEKLMLELPPHLSCIIAGLSRIAENSATIAAIAINRALKKPSDLYEPY